MIPIIYYNFPYKNIEKNRGLFLKIVLMWDKTNMGPASDAGSCFLYKTNETLFS